MTPSAVSRAVLRSAGRIQSHTNMISSNMAASGAGAPLRWNGISRRTMVFASPVLLEQRTLKLPGLGDSITEGAIVEWTAAVGQAVKEGDVVAMIETDKVTVDIKAEMDGVVVEHFCAVDDTLEVGADLYKIDTEAEASVGGGASESASAPEPATAPAKTTTKAPKVAAASASAPSLAAAKNSSSHRTPSIHFLGKDGWAKRLSGEQTPSIVYIPPMYGRPAFTEEEMEALVMGGANLVPNVKVHSSGAIFG